MVSIMKMAKAFVVKLGIYTVVFTYILLDLFVFHGPLKAAVADRSAGSGTVAEQMHKEKIAAFLYRQPIYLSQLDYAVKQRADTFGVDVEALTEKQLKSLRVAVLNELVDDALLRLKVEGNESDFSVGAKEVDSATTRIVERFKDSKLMEEVASSHGLDGERELKLRAKAMLEQDAYLSLKLGSSIVVPEEVVKAHYDGHRENYRLDSGGVATFDEVKQEISEAIRSMLLAAKVKEYRGNLQLHTGVSHRHLDSSRDYVNRKDKANRVEIFNDIFSEPFGS